MKIAIIAASGELGQALTQLALDIGHEVIALVRNKDKITLSHDLLKVRKYAYMKIDTNLPNCKKVSKFC